MGRTTARAVAALAAALVCAGCGPGAGQAPATTRPLAARSGPAANTAACYALAVSALRRHVIVRRPPRECAGLGPAQVNEVVGRALRTVAGPLPKAAARRRDLADSRYLASLIRQAGPPRPASLAAGPASTPDPLVARLAALAAWLSAALAGGYLLIDRRRASARRQIRALGLPYLHAGLAATGLCIWVSFMVTAAPALGWTDVALTWVIVGLGMATLLADGPASPPGTVLAPAAATTGGATPGARAHARAPVLVIALHGALAAVTILLVLLAVIGTG
jgi:hypothetical protein